MWVFYSFCALAVFALVLLILFDRHVQKMGFPYPFYPEREEVFELRHEIMIEGRKTPIWERCLHNGKRAIFLSKQTAIEAVENDPQYCDRSSRKFRVYRLTEEVVYESDPVRWQGGKNNSHSDGHQQGGGI